MAYGVMDYNPVRGFLRSLGEEPEEFEFPMNPTRLSEQVEVLWRQQQVIGMSHPRMQYTGTGAWKLPGVEFMVNRYRMAEARKRAISIGEFLDFKRFLSSLTVPESGTEDIIGGSPSRVLFVWPSVISLTCVLTNLNITYLKFSIHGEPLIYTARVGFSEIRDIRMTSSELRKIGSQRAEV